MPKTLGNARKCYIGVASGNSTTYTWLTGEQSNNFNLAGNLVDSSDKSTLWQTFLQGIRGATASVNVHTDDSDTQQKAAITALHNGTVVKVFIGVLSENTPSQGDAFDALVSDISDTNDNGTVASRVINLTANGAVVHYPAS